MRCHHASRSIGSFLSRYEFTRNVSHPRSIVYSSTRRSDSTNSSSELRHPSVPLYPGRFRGDGVEAQHKEQDGVARIPTETFSWQKTTDNAKPLAALGHDHLMWNKVIRSTTGAGRNVEVGCYTSVPTSEMAVWNRCLKVHGLALAPRMGSCTIPAKGVSRANDAMTGSISTPFTKQAMKYSTSAVTQRSDKRTPIAADARPHPGKNTRPKKKDLRNNTSKNAQVLQDVEIQIADEHQAKTTPAKGARAQQRQANEKRAIVGKSQPSSHGQEVSHAEHDREGHVLTEKQSGKTRSKTKDSLAQKQKSVDPKNSKGQQNDLSEEEDKENWQIQKAALKSKFGEEGWNPRKRLSPDALEGIRALHKSDPEKFTTPILADHFKVSSESIRRILKSKWQPNEEEAEDRRQRWDKRGEKIWASLVEKGIRPPKKWREMGVGKAEPGQAPKWVQDKSKLPRKKAKEDVPWDDGRILDDADEGPAISVGHRIL